MQRLLGRFGILGLVVLPAVELAACSSGQKAYIPVDSALRTWQPPEADAYTPPPSPAAPAAPAPAQAKEAAKKK